MLFKDTLVLTQILPILHEKMFKSYEFLLIVLLYQCIINNCVECNKNVTKNYELLDGDYYFKDVTINAKTIALLIEDSPGNFKNVLSFTQTVFSDNDYKNSDFWLVTFNSSGVSSVWDKSYNNINQFYRKIESLTSQSNFESEERTNNKSLVLFALLNTAQTLPENAAIILFTNSFKILDTHLEKSTLNNILRKNISVYTINDRELEVNSVIKNIVDFSGGKTFKIPTRTRYEMYQQDPYKIPKENVSVILTRKNANSVSNLSFPVDHDITGLHIVISPSKTTAGLLVSPSGYRFSFSKNAKSNNIRYSPGSFFDNQNGFIELHLNFSTSDRSNIGNWQLKLENSIELYNITVFGFSSISAEARINFSQPGPSVYETSMDVMKLGVTGEISHITDISVLDSNGETVLSNISYKFNNNRLNYVTENIDNVPDTLNKVNVEINRLSYTQPVYALIKGKDIKGNIFQRLGYIFGLGRSNIYPQQFLTVEIGLGSELIAASGKRAEVYFEVTNHASSAQLVSFTCSDQKYILQSLSIYRRYLEPQESTIVTLYLNTKYGTYQDEITFSASSGSLVVQKRVFVDVGSQITDQTKPEIWHKYTSDCTGVIFTSCTKGTWTIEITTKDSESGVLQLNTIPKGLYFPHGYTSGTKDFVTGYFSESCCNPKLQISAVDRSNNIRSYDVNAYYSRWSPGAIAALVLGIILFIILVAVIIFFACRRWKKKKESYELPTYRGEGI